MSRCGENKAYYVYNLTKVNSNGNISRTTTLIKDFDGEVEYYIDDAEGEAHIIGTGNVNFFTTQTGF